VVLEPDRFGEFPQFVGGAGSGAAEHYADQAVCGSTQSHLLRRDLVGLLEHTGRRRVVVELHVRVREIDQVLAASLTQWFRQVVWVDVLGAAQGVVPIAEFDRHLDAVDASASASISATSSTDTLRASARRGRYTGTGLVSPRSQRATVEVSTPIAWARASWLRP
jgi:hypothetical protein